MIQLSFWNKFWEKGESSYLRASFQSERLFPDTKLIVWLVWNAWMSSGDQFTAPSILTFQPINIGFPLRFCPVPVLREKSPLFEKNKFIRPTKKNVYGSSYKLSFTIRGQRKSFFLWRIVTDVMSSENPFSVGRKKFTNEWTFFFWLS